MLKPVTDQERLTFTLKIQAAKATEEILADLFHEQKYKGVVDIWPVLSIAKNGQVVLTVEYKKVQPGVVRLTHQHATRFIVDPVKGVKQLS